MRRIIATIALVILAIGSIVAVAHAEEPAAKITSLAVRAESACGKLTMSYATDPEDAPVEVYRKVNDGEWQRQLSEPRTRFEEVKPHGAKVSYKIVLGTEERIESATTYACASSTPTPTSTPSEERLDATCHSPEASARKKEKRGLANTGGPRSYAKPPKCDEKQAVVASDYRTQIFDLTNVERRKRGLPAFKRDECLHNSAQYWSGRMVASAKVYHSDMGQLMSTCKLAGVGENVASGFSTPQGVVNAWMASPGHRENILNPRFTKLGTGWSYGYATQQFGV